MRRDTPSRPWHLYSLGLAAVALAVLAALQIGPPSSSARTAREIVTAEDGVAQSTVTGSGNVEAGTDVDVNFRTSGTLQAVYVSLGQHVNKGQLLATLNPAAAQLAVDQAQASLTAAEDQLTAAESGTATGGGSTSTTTSLTGVGGSVEYVSDTRSPGGTGTGKTRTKTTPTETITTITTITTEPATGRRTPSSTPGGSGSARGGASGSNSAGGTRGGAGGSGSAGAAGSGSTRSTAASTPSPASIASAQAAVYAAQASLQNAQTALADTRLYAPVSGTIVSLADLLPGDSVSAGASSSAAGSSSPSTSSSSSSSTAGGLGSSSSSGSGSSQPFAEIVNRGTMTMTVAFSESDISKIRVGQPATVTLDALPGVELAAHVSQVSDVGTVSSGVVSYNATLTLDQTNPEVKPGMSASASVIVAQAQGVTVPNAAVTGSGSLGTVQLLRNGRPVAQQVVVGLRGDSRTQIISGLSAGQQLVVTIALPALGTGTTPTTSASPAFGGAGLRGLLGGGAGAFFRGGGGFLGARGGG